jgi:hypothetical protein
LELLAHLREIGDQAQVIRVLHQNTKKLVCLTKVELLWLLNDQLTADSLRSCLDQVDGLREDLAGDEELVPLASMDVIGHVHGFTCG